MNMSETEKDSGIRLFGRQIPLPEFQIPANSGPMDTCSSTKKTEAEKISCVENTKQQEKSQELKYSKQDSQHNNVQENQPKVDNSKSAEEDTRDEDKLLKKPDKILQCPRCNSLDTKFCYFNNYNVNQPRHFCKNCQRYWTAGGTMRNVPIGAGRRKNKQLASHYRQIVITSDGIPTSRLETTVSTGHQQISGLDSSAGFRSSTRDNETVLKFGPDICEPMESMLNLRDQKSGADGNSISCVEYKEEPSLCVSSVTNSGTQGNELLSENNKTSNWLQCYPVPPWVVPWNPSWNNVASTAAVHNPYSTAPTAMQWCPTPMLQIPGISPPNIPLQLVSAPYWSGAPMLAMGSRACISPSSSTSTSGCSGNGTPSLGKHTRDTSFTDEDKLDKSSLVQKIIRIEEPNKASKRVENNNGEGKDLVLGSSKRVLNSTEAVIKFIVKAMKQ